MHGECNDTITLIRAFQQVLHLSQDFLRAASQLAMTRAQSAANALADRIEELAVHATFVQVGPSVRDKWSDLGAKSPLWKGTAAVTSL